MLTPLGRQIRILRIDKDVQLKEMAESFGVKSSFLSAIENGRKSLPEEWVEKLDRYFAGFGVAKETWKKLAELSKAKISIDLSGADEFDRETALAFGRNYHSLPADRKKEIRKLLTDE